AAVAGPAVVAGHPAAGGRHRPAVVAGRRAAGARRRGAGGRSGPPVADRRAGRAAGGVPGAPARPRLRRRGHRPSTSDIASERLLASVTKMPRTADVTVVEP